MAELLIDRRVFWAEVREETARAQEIIDQRGQFDCERPQSGHPLGEEREVLDDQLGSILKRLRLYVLLATDILGAESFWIEFEAGWKEHAKSLTGIEYSHWADVVYSPALQYLTDAFFVLSVCIPAEDVQQYKRDQE